MYVFGYIPILETQLYMHIYMCLNTEFLQKDPWEKC